MKPIDTTDDNMMEDEEGGLDLREIMISLIRRWRMIAGIVVLFTAAGVSYALTIPNYYTASATVQIDRRAKTITHIDGVLADLKADRATLESEVQVIAAPTIAQRVIERLNLRNDPEFNNTALVPRSNEKRSAVNSNNSIAQAHKGETTTFSKSDTEKTHALKRDRVVQRFLNNLEVRRVGNSLVIKVNYTSRNPVKAARIANAIVDVYIESQFEDKRDATQIAVSLIDDRLNGLRKRLAESERNIARFKTNNDIFDSKGHALQDHQLASELNGLLKAKDQTAQTRSQYEQAKQLATLKGALATVPDAIRNDTIRHMRSSLSTAIRRQGVLATKYGPLHPEMRKAQADLNKARSELRQEIRKVLKTLKVEYDVAKNRQAQLERRFKEFKGKVNIATAQKWKLHELEREAKANQQLYEVLLSRKKQAEETRGMHFPDAKFVAQAEVPLETSKPKRKKIVLIVFAAGLALALGIAITLDLMAGGLTDPEKIQKEFGLPHLASVPNLQRREDGFDSALHALRLMLTHPNGVYAESMREILYELDWRHHHRGPRTILVTSAMCAEGKSLAASNLAHNLALTGRRTLLIDADIRKQTLTTTLRATGHSGLYEVLCKGRPIDDAILKDETTGLSFMPAASTPAASAPPTEILASRHTQALLMRLKKSYDTIIVDAPPLLPVIDARILANQADQILFMMNWQATPKRSVHRALRSLAMNAHKVAGIVLNGTDPAEFKNRLTYRTPNTSQSHVAPHTRRAA